MKRCAGVISIVVFMLVATMTKAETTHTIALWPLLVCKQIPQEVSWRLLTFVPIGLFDLDEISSSCHVLNVFWWGRSLSQVGLSTREPSVFQTHGFYPLYSFAKYNGTKWRPSTTDGRTTATLVQHKAFNLVDPIRPLNRHVSYMWETPNIMPLFSYYYHQEGTTLRRWQVALGLFKWARGLEWYWFVHNPYESALWLGTPFIYAYYGDKSGWGEPYHSLHVFSLFWDNLLPESHSQGLWPLYTYRRNKNGALRVAFLDPLWPLSFLAEVSGIEEHVSDLFRVFNYHRQPNDDSRFSFLWRVFSYEKADGKRSMRLFFSPRIGLGATRPK